MTLLIRFIALIVLSISAVSAQTNCSFTLTPTSVTLPAGGGTGTIAVSAPAGCSWSPAPSVPWILIAFGQSGTANGSVGYTVQANSTAQSRSGTMTIGTQIFTVNQQASSTICTFTLPVSNRSLPSTGGSGSFDVVAPAGCGWIATPGASWISISFGSSGTGNGSVGYSAAPNTSTQPRTGTISVANRTFTIDQAASAAQVSVRAVANAASFRQGPVAPGSIITIFGSGIGPAVPATLQLTNDGQFLTTILGDTRVLFDQVSAPLVYASEGQVSAIVPYAVAGRGSAQLQVEYKGNRSNSVTLNVAQTAPAIFTLDSSGGGPGAILNQDFSVNSASNAAAKGSIVQIFATGEGQTVPPGVDGRLAGDILPRPALPVTVRIAGMPAEVLYSGAAPGLVAGVIQINARIPMEAPSGPAVPVVFQVGPFESPGQVTVSVQ